jgi:hypothetical protein
MKFLEKLNDTMTQAALSELGVDIRAYESGVLSEIQESTTGAPHAEPGAFEKIKGIVEGHGERVVLPDDCGFGDNDLCSVEA